MICFLSDDTDLRAFFMHLENPENLLQFTVIRQIVSLLLSEHIYGYFGWSTGRK